VDLKPGDLVTALGPARSDRDGAVRAAVVDAIGGRPEPAAEAMLVDALSDPLEVVRRRAASALAARSWEPGTEAQRAALWTAQGDLQKAASLGGAAVGPLARVLGEGVYYRSVAAIGALRQIGNAEAIQALLGSLFAAEPQVRAAAAGALAEAADRRAVKPLIGLLRDPDAHVCAEAAEALGRLGDPEAAGPLLAGLGHSSWEVRRALLVALGRLGHARGFDAVAGLLKDRHRDVRESAVAVLEVLGPERAVECLVPMLKDEEERVRAQAGAALRRLDPAWEKSEAARRAVPELRAALKHREYWVRQAAADALGKIGERQAVEPRLAGLFAQAQLRRQSLVDIVRDLLADWDPDLRRAGAQVLGRLGDPRAIEWLVERLNDPEIGVRRSAAGALRQFHWAPTDPVARAGFDGLLEGGEL
jgi:HEAT repeat protein